MWPPKVPAIPFESKHPLFSSNLGRFRTFEQTHSGGEGTGIQRGRGRLARSGACARRTAVATLMMNAGTAFTSLMVRVDAVEERVAAAEAARSAAEARCAAAEARVAALERAMYGAVRLPAAVPVMSTLPAAEVEQASPGCARMLVVERTRRRLASSAVEEQGGAGAEEAQNLATPPAGGRKATDLPTEGRRPLGEVGQKRARAVSAGGVRGPFDAERDKGRRGGGAGKQGSTGVQKKQEVLPLAMNRQEDVAESRMQQSLRRSPSNSASSRRQRSKRRWRRSGLSGEEALEQREGCAVESAPRARDRCDTGGCNSARRSIADPVAPGAPASLNGPAAAPAGLRPAPNLSPACPARSARLEEQSKTKRCKGKERKEAAKNDDDVAKVEPARTVAHEDDNQTPSEGGSPWIVPNHDAAAAGVAGNLWDTPSDQSCAQAAEDYDPPAGPKHKPPRFTSVSAAVRFVEEMQEKRVAEEAGVYNQTVRGKARAALNAEACQECESFYRSVAAEDEDPVRARLPSARWT
jgi:hypothetical protein